MAPDFKVARAVLYKAPNEVITVIFNEALNGRQGTVDISPHLITILTGFVTVKSQFLPATPDPLKGLCSFSKCTTFGHNALLNR